VWLETLTENDLEDKYDLNQSRAVILTDNGNTKEFALKLFSAFCSACTFVVNKHFEIMKLNKNKELTNDQIIMTNNPCMPKLTSCHTFNNNQSQSITAFLPLIKLLHSYCKSLLSLCQKEYFVLNKQKT